jgi:hypothetical protein
MNTIRGASTRRETFIPLHVFDMLDESSTADPAKKYARSLPNKPAPLRSDTSDPRTQYIFWTGLKTLCVQTLRLLGEDTSTVTVGQPENLFTNTGQPQILNNFQGTIYTLYSTIVTNPPEKVLELGTSVDRSWLATLELGNRATSDELITTIDRLNIVMKNRNFELMDAIFRQLDVTSISPEMMLAFIRTTFAVRSKLGEWCQLRDRVRAELSARRFDPDILLKGLG